MNKLEWHEVRDEWLGTVAGEIVCSISKMEERNWEGYGLECFSPNQLFGVYLSIEGAKARAEELYAQRETARAASQVNYGKIFAQLIPILAPLLGGNIAVARAVPEDGANVAQTASPEAKQCTSDLSE